MSKRKEEPDTWGWVKASGVGVLQLGAVIVFGTLFYSNTLNYQQKTDQQFAENDKRFEEFSKAREKQLDQMSKMQEGQSAMLIEVKTMGANLGSLIEAVKETRTEQSKLGDTIRDLKGVR